MLVLRFHLNLNCDKPVTPDPLSSYLIQRDAVLTRASNALGKAVTLT